jgi:hypothetical protein
MVRQLTILCLALCIGSGAIGATEVAPEGARLVEVTGRVVYDDSKPIEDIRRLALNEALYLAALQGAASVDGYSALDSETALNEAVIVRPAGEILDYTIIEDGRKQDHYEMRLRVAVSSHADRACPTNIMRQVEIFQPEIYVSQNVPVWSSRAVQLAWREVLDGVAGDPQVAVVDNSSQSFDVKAMQNNGGAMDYNALLAARATSHGDYALVSRITLAAKKDRFYGIADKNQLVLTVELTFYAGPDFKTAKTHRFEKELMGSFDSFFEPINLLANPGREDRLRALMPELRPFIDDVMIELACLPRSGRLARVNNNYYVDLGRRHGLREQQLAVIPDQVGSWNIVRVTRLEDDRAYVLPLDGDKDLNGLVGRDTRFMEVN